MEKLPQEGMENHFKYSLNIFQEPFNLSIKREILTEESRKQSRYFIHEFLFNIFLEKHIL